MHFPFFFFFSHFLVFIMSSHEASVVDSVVDSVVVTVVGVSVVGLSVVVLVVGAWVVVPAPPQALG